MMTKIRLLIGLAGILIFVAQGQASAGGTMTLDEWEQNFGEVFQAYLLSANDFARAALEDYESGNTDPHSMDDEIKKQNAHIQNMLDICAKLPDVAEARHLRMSCDLLVEQLGLRY